MALMTLWHSGVCYLTAHKSIHGFSWQRSTNPWSLHDPALVLGLRLGPQGIEKVFNGSAGDQRARQQALRHLLGLEVSARQPDDVPFSVREGVSAKVRQAVAQVTQEYGSFGTENHITGAFFRGISGVWSLDGWTVTVRQQQYSPNCGFRPSWTAVSAHRDHSFRAS